MPKEWNSDDVVEAWNNFLEVYGKFKSSNGLPESQMGAFEICTALTDKNGRIAREIKHFERNDPKPNFPSGLTEAMTGYLIYMLMLISRYNIKIDDGMKKELDSAVSQWSRFVDKKE